MNFHKLIKAVAVVVAISGLYSAQVYAITKAHWSTTTPTGGNATVAVGYPLAVEYQVQNMDQFNGHELAQGFYDGHQWGASNSNWVWNGDQANWNIPAGGVTTVKGTLVFLLAGNYNIAPGGELRDIGTGYFPVGTNASSLDMSATVKVVVINPNPTVR